jgi:hypothetical protein
LTRLLRDKPPQRREHKRTELKSQPTPLPTPEFSCTCLAISGWFHNCHSWRTIAPTGYIVLLVVTLVPRVTDSVLDEYRECLPGEMKNG